jgi:serine/threonine protein kinase
VGRHIGRYRIDRILGEGGMGVVYLAHDSRMNRAVALKALSGSIASDEANRNRLKREALAAGSLAHPGIAIVYDFEEVGDDAFISSEFIQGATLREEMGQGRMGAAAVLAAAIELADALAAAHAKGIVHRDLKPENVIRSTTAGLKILDFGLAQMRDSPPELPNLSSDGRVFGTPAYMSPEQIQRLDIDGRSDLFSLGIMLHEMLTGIHPFAGADTVSTIARIVKSEPAIAPSPPPHTTNIALHEGLMHVILTLLQKEPGARFSSAQDLLQALKTLRAGGVITVPVAAPIWTPARHWWRIHVASVSVAYALLLIPVAYAADYLDPLDQRLRMFLFMIGLGPAVGAVAIRMHLWFEATARPADWVSQFERSRRWLRLCDLAFVVIMIGLGLALTKEHNVWATILVAGGVLSLVSAMIIEPSTTRAAFDRS